MDYSKDHIEQLLREQEYVSDPSITMSVYLAMSLKKPLLIEGPAGVGKTEIAKVLSNALGTDLIRLQCYEGLDSNHALYEWNYTKQLLYLKMVEKSDQTLSQKEEIIYSNDFLLERPLLASIKSKNPIVLLIDEIDRADEEFESFFLELLSDWQITIPEIGTIEANSIPYVMVTSNRNRELSEALRRRCLYLWIDYPSFEKELQIIKTKIPNINEILAIEICQFMKELRNIQLEKLPGVSESLDWAVALSSMHIDHLDKNVIESTLGVVLKDWQDIREARDSLSELFQKVKVISKIG